MAGILGLDMATKTGWAYVQGGKVIESGVQDFTKGRGESNGLLFLRFRKWLHCLQFDLAQLGGIKLVAYERAHFRGGAATEIGVGLQTRAQEFAADIEVESAPVATNTLKKWATGSGAAGKDAMINRAAVILGRMPIDDNEADAVLCALWAEDQFVVPETGGLPGRNITEKTK